MNKLFPFFLIFLIACTSTRARVDLEQQLDRTFNLVDTYVRTFDGTEAQSYLISTYPAVHDEAVLVLEEWHRTGKQPVNAPSAYKKLKEIEAYVTRVLSTNYQQRLNNGGNSP